MRYRARIFPSAGAWLSEPISRTAMPRLRTWPQQAMVEMKTHGSAVWQGGLKAGKGAISTKSGTLKDCPYGLSSRFEGKPSTNPEELGTAAAAPALAASSFTAPRALSVKATLSRCQGLTANFH